MIAVLALEIITGKILNNLKKFGIGKGVTIGVVCVWFARVLTSTLLFGISLSLPPSPSGYASFLPNSREAMDTIRFTHSRTPGGRPELSVTRAVLTPPGTGHRTHSTDSARGWKSRQHLL